MLNRFNQLRAAAIKELPKAGMLKSINVDLDKLLAVQGILRVTKNHSAEVKTVLGESTLLKIKKKMFGKTNRMPSSSKDELEDILLDYQDTDDEDKGEEELEEKLFALKKNSGGAVAQVTKVFMELYEHMETEREVVNGMFLQSGLVPALCRLFKATKHHHPKGYNKALFPLAAAVSGCHPDFVVSVGSSSPFINVVGEIKGEDASKEYIALDTYRLGLFGLMMLREHRLKSSLVFQVVGLNTTFYLCSRLGGIVAMVEVGSLSLPSTFVEFAHFGSQAQTMFDVAMLYQKHCNIDHSLTIHKWKLVSYSIIKELYDVCSTKTSTVKASGASSTEAQS
ncbi:hypothetical protein BD560DRAFT_384837 [Blakeslea trispora]|nr:hypothetical protein BD560DRAFT_384837 [Blakeslea trispora]